MKRFLLCLFIVINLIILPVFADDEPIEVIDMVNGAIQNTVAQLDGYGLALDYVHNYLVTNSIIDNTSKYILFPTDVDYSGSLNDIYITFQLLVSSSSNFNDKFVSISLPRANFYSGHYDLWVGYTGNWTDITAKTYKYYYDFSDFQQVGSLEITDNTSTVRSRWGSPWRTNFLFDNLGTRYLLVADEHSIATTGGLYYSIYSSQDLLPTYYGEFGGGFNAGTWDDHYTINPNYVINVFRSNGSNVTNVNTGVYVNSYGITFDNNGINNSDMSYNIDSLWGTLKNNLFNLIGGLGIVISLFTVVFAWLPPDIVFLIYSGLIFVVTLLIIKAIRGG